MILRVLFTGTALLLLTVAAAVGAAASTERLNAPLSSRGALNGISISGLENVRAYTAATRPGGRSYAVDSGWLYAGAGAAWQSIAVPPDVIVNAVAVDRLNPDTVYIGAANSLTVFVSRDAGQDWLEIPLDSDAIGGVTALAFDASNRLLYVGTDNDGLHRLRDVGVTLIASGHLLLDEAVEEVVSDSTGAGMAFVRTQWNLYRAEGFGLRWVAVDGLPSPPMALAIADGAPPTVYVGTAGAGVLMSQDGVAWRSRNQGLRDTPDARLVISDLVVDPAQPEVIYAGTSLLLGSGAFQLSPIGVAMTTDGGIHWTALAEAPDAPVAELLPVTGRTGTVYALTTVSRTPLALGAEPAREALNAPLLERGARETLNAPLLERGAREAASLASGLSATGLLAWVLAGLASAALIIIVVIDIARGRRRAADVVFKLGTARLG